MVKKQLTIFFISSQLLISNQLCRLKIAKEQFLVDGYKTWIVDQNRSFAFVPNQLNLHLPTGVNLIKRNSIFGLSMFESKDLIIGKEPIKIKTPKKPNRFVMNESVYSSGYISKPQIGLQFAEYSESIDDNLRIVSGCCFTTGITVGDNKFIDIDFVKFFLHSKDGLFSDIGARFEEINGSIFVKYSNPFFVDNKFVQDDQILYFNGERPKSIELFLKDILMSKIGTVFNFEVLRDKELLDFNITTSELKSGGFLSDTFMENLGIWFDDGLFVANVHNQSSFSQKGLRPTYRLISINDVDMKNELDVKQYLSSQKKNMPESFQFLFRHKSKGDLNIQLKPNPKYFKSANNENSGWGDNNGFADSFSTNNNSGWGFSIESQEDDINESFYDMFNKQPLTEYLKQ